MSHLAFWIAAWGGAATGFTLTALITTSRLRARSQAAAAKVMRWPRVALVRPCEGLDPSLGDTLRSSLRARYDGQRAIFFCVPSLHDPAYAVPVEVRDELVAAGGDAQPPVPAPRHAADRQAAQPAFGPPFLPLARRPPRA